MVFDIEDPTNFYWYNDYSPIVPGTPPNWVFPLAWTIIFACISLAMTRFQDEQLGKFGWPKDAVTILITFHVISILAWYNLFFGMRAFTSALFATMVIFSTGLALFVIFGQQHNWASFGLFVFPNIWYLYALILTSRWVELKSKNATSGYNQLR
jgi:tryptophan-rich sensory protein